MSARFELSVFGFVMGALLAFVVALAFTASHATGTFSALIPIVVTKWTAWLGTVSGGAVGAIGGSRLHR